MSSTEVDERVNLKEIVDISEDEFKRQISAWIDERGISRKLQSKLRADLFEQFNRTKLGRQMTEQHQQAHRIVLSPLILVLNTLVAEFLYTEDCHFTLSVFANEVPYKNTLPNFEETPSRQLFRFSNSELNDIFEAIGVSKRNEQVIRDFYSKLGGNGQETLNKSLLYCILKILIPQIDRQSANKRPASKTSKPKPSTSKAVVVSTSSQQSLDPSPPSKMGTSSSVTPRVKCNSLQISSRYFKYLNRYLEILSDRMNDMSKSLADKRSGHKIQKSNVESSTQEVSLRKDLRKIIHNINKLTKSQRKSKRFQDVLNSIERLSASVEKCSGKMGELLTVVNIQSKTQETVEKKAIDKKDRFSEMDYGSWLKELKTSEHGRKFIDRLEVSLQKTMAKERENLEKLYEEKTNNYRMLIRLHYKQKYDAMKSECELKDHTEKLNSSPIDKITPDNTEKLLAESLAERAIEKEKQVDDIVQTAKSRLHQLERESEELDQSFQAYLRRQQISRKQINDDASRIWENYSMSKAALTKFDKISEKHPIVTAFQPNFTDFLNQDQVFNSTFYDDVDITVVLKDLNEIKRLRSPQFNKNEAFPKESLLPRKSHGHKFEPLIDHKEKLFQRVSNAQDRIVSTDKFMKPMSKIPMEIAPESTMVRQNGTMNLNPEVKLAAFEPKTNGLTIKTGETKGKINGNDEMKKKDANVKIAENREKVVNEEKVEHNSTTPNTMSQISRSVDKSVEQTQNVEKDNAIEKSVTTSPEKSLEKILDLKINSNGLTNGHKVENIEKKASIEAVEIKEVEAVENKEVEAVDKKQEESKLFSPLKTNGFGSISLLEKQPSITISNGLNHTPEVKRNGFANKMTPFVSRISDSDSVEMESEQISIGRQRLVKSPDDFWI